MSDVCLMNVVLVWDAFEARLGRPLTSEERQDVQNLGKEALEELEEELDKTTEAAGVARILMRVRGPAR